MLLGGVVDQDVEAAKSLRHPTDRALAERLIADVTSDEHAPATLLLDQSLRLFRVVVLVQVDDADIGTFFRERDRHGAPDATVAAGDERDLSAELPAAALLRVVALRARPHADSRPG